MAKPLDPARAERYRKSTEAKERPASANSETFMKFWKCPVTNGIDLRILPAKDPDDPNKDFFFTAFEHFKVNPEAPNMKVICPSSMDPTSNCPVCARARSLYKSGNEADKELAKKISRQERNYIGIIPREGEDAGEIRVFGVSGKILQKIQRNMNNKHYGDITDPFEGFDITYNRVGTGPTDTRYDFEMTPVSSPLADTAEEIERIMNNLPDLWKYGVAAPVEEIRKFMSGEITELLQGPRLWEQLHPDADVPDDAPEEPEPTEETTVPVVPKTVVIKAARPEPTPEPEPEPFPAKKPPVDIAALKNKYAKAKPAV